MNGFLMSGTGGTDITAALETIGTVVTKCVGIITDNAILFAMFAAGLLGVGFKVFRSAKKAAVK